jgi:hypothetical protein
MRCCLLRVRGRSLVGGDRRGRLDWLEDLVSWGCLNERARTLCTIVGIY